MNRALVVSYSEGTKLDEHEDFDTYDYPYMEGGNILYSKGKGSSSEHSQIVPEKTVRHNRVHIPKSLSYDNNTSPDHIVDIKRHELSQPSQQQIERTSSQIEILESLAEGEDYVKMHPEQAKAMVKSHSYDDSRMLQSMSNQNRSTRASPPVDSQMEDGYKRISRLTLETDGKWVIVPTHCLYIAFQGYVLCLF